MPVWGEGKVGGAGVAAIDGPFGFPWSWRCSVGSIF